MKKNTLLAAALMTAIAAGATTEVGFDLQQSSFDGADKLPLYTGTRTRDLPEGFEVIMTPPAGEAIPSKIEAHGYKYSGGLYKASGMTPSTVVWCDNGDVYIKNPISQYATQSFLKGHVEGDKVVVDLPQSIYDSIYYGTFFANLMKFDPEKEWYCNVAENNRVEYIIGEDRSLTLSLPGDAEEYILGMTYDNDAGSTDSWAMYGDWQQTISRFTDTMTTLPEGVTPEVWEMVCEGNNGSNVYVAFDGDDVYLGNFYKSIPEAYVKGKYSKTRGTVSFPMPQYIGMDPRYDCFDYFVTAKPVRQGTTITGYTLTSDIVFEYDPEKQEMREANGRYMFVNDGYERVYYIEAFASPMLRVPVAGNDLADPVDPIFQTLVPYTDAKRCGYIVWDIPNINVKGAVLNTERMSYCMFVDEELYTFYPDEYKGFAEEISQLPWDFNDYYAYDLFHEGARHTIYFYFRDARYYGLQSIYEAEDGNIFYSGVTTYDAETDKVISGVPTISDREACGLEYHDMAGRWVANPEQGIYIRTLRFTDGSVKSEKVILK